MNSKTLTLRLSADSYAKAAILAKRRGQSLNRLVQDGLRLLDRQEQERQLFEDFSIIASGGVDETDVEFAIAAQTEVIQRP